MIVFFSGGSPIVETTLPDPAVMLSYFVDVKSGKPASRMRQIMAIRTKEKPCQSKSSSKSPPPKAPNPPKSKLRLRLKVRKA